MPTTPSTAPVTLPLFDRFALKLVPPQRGQAPEHVVLVNFLTAPDIAGVLDVATLDCRVIVHRVQVSLTVC
jgi:hypothetical protein